MKKILFWIGAILLITGIGMFLFGASMFSYQGNDLSPLKSEIGKYCFLYFVPVIIIAVIFFIMGAFIKK